MAADVVGLSRVQRGLACLVAVVLVVSVAGAMAPEDYPPPLVLIAAIKHQP